MTSTISETKLAKPTNKKPRQTMLSVSSMYGDLKDRKMDNAVFVKDKAYLGFEDVEFVRLETGFVCKLKEDATVSTVDEVAIPDLLRVKYFDNGTEDSIDFGDDTVLTAVDPESVFQASVLRVTVSNPFARFDEHAVVDRKDVVETIRRRFNGHILTKDAVLKVVVRGQTLRLQVTDIDSMANEPLDVVKIGVFTDIYIVSAMGLKGVTLLSEFESKPQVDESKVETPAPKVDASKVDGPQQPDEKAHLIKIRVLTADIDPKPMVDDTTKSSEALTCESTKAFWALMAIFKFNLEFKPQPEYPDISDAIHSVSKVLELRLKQIAKEMERRST